MELYATIWVCLKVPPKVKSKISEERTFIVMYYVVQIEAGPDKQLCEHEGTTYHHHGPSAIRSPHQFLVLAPPSNSEYGLHSPSPGILSSGIV